jgi:hypothetical protein
MFPRRPQRFCFHYYLSILSHRYEKNLKINSLRCQKAKPQYRILPFWIYAKVWTKHWHSKNTCGWVAHTPYNQARLGKIDQPHIRLVFDQNLHYLNNLKVRG